VGRITPKGVDLSTTTYLEDDEVGGGEKE